MSIASQTQIWLIKEAILRMQHVNITHIFRELNHEVGQLEKYKETAELEGELTLEHDLEGISLLNAQFFL